jgi:N-acetylglucosaminyldiphosphoundecaprenol N-acetyl-beta-D-mannosaminyltransferase
MALARTWTRHQLLGSAVDAVSMDDVVAIAAKAISRRERCRIVVTNANKAWQAAKNPRLRTIMAESELVIPEWATLWAAERLGLDGIHHIGGLTLMSRLLEEAPARGWTVYLLGAERSVVDALASHLRAREVPVTLVGWHDGFLRDDLTRRRVKDELRTLRPNLLFVAMGSPLQEYFMDELGADGGGACVSLGVGGSFDVLAGLKTDAPSWMRGRGLEWLYRMALDPRRYAKRYLVTNSWFVWNVFRTKLFGSRSAM